MLCYLIAKWLFFPIRSTLSTAFFRRNRKQSQFLLSYSSRHKMYFCFLFASPLFSAEWDNYVYLNWICAALYKPSPRKWFGCEQISRQRRISQKLFSADTKIALAHGAPDDVDTILIRRFDVQGIRSERVKIATQPFDIENRAPAPAVAKVCWPSPQQRPDWARARGRYMWNTNHSRFHGCFSLPAHSHVNGTLLLSLAEQSWA